METEGTVRIRTRVTLQRGNSRAPGLQDQLLAACTGSRGSPLITARSSSDQGHCPLTAEIMGLNPIRVTSLSRGCLLEGPACRPGAG